MGIWQGGGEETGQNSTLPQDRLLFLSFLDSLSSQTRTARRAFTFG